jgi:hypothetical protein
MLFVIFAGMDLNIGMTGMLAIYFSVSVVLSLLADYKVANISNYITLTFFSILIFILDKLSISDKELLLTETQLNELEALGDEGIKQLEELLANNPELLRNTLIDYVVGWTINAIAPLILLWVIIRMLIECKAYAIKKYGEINKKDLLTAVNSECETIAQPQD